MRVHCFIEKDEEYYAELERLKRAVVMHTKDFQWELSVDNVSSYACRTKLVQKDEIEVSELSGSRFLILLPEGLDPDTFINATPQDAWDDGLSFQPWSPLEDAGISIPAYKVLLRLVGLPPHLCREKHIIRAVSRFGVFLGSIQPENPSSLASSLVAIGVDDLSLIPPELVMHIGGLTHDVLVHTLAYNRSPIYTAEDLPKHPKVYKRPQPPPSSTTSSDDEVLHDENELIPMSSNVLRELCRGKTADTLPPELRRFATMEEMVLQHPDTVTQDHATKDPPADILDSFINSADSLIDSQRSADLLAINDTNNNEMDHVVSLGAAASTLNNAACHNKSNGTLSIPSVSIEKSLLPLGDLSTQDLVSHSIQHSLAQSQPQKILLRGSSSGNNSSHNSIPSRRDPRERISRRIIPTPSDNSIPSRIRKSAPVISLMAQIPERNDSQFAMDPKLNEHQSMLDTLPASRFNGCRIPGINSQSKNKGPLSTSFKGPYASKYNWNKSNNSGPARKIKEAAPLKRKSQSQSFLSEPVKKISARGKEKAAVEVALNPRGFYEAKVNHDHVSMLAKGCGFTVKDVEEALQTDNLQREIQAAKELTEPIKENLGDEDLDLGRFDPDSEDELTSDEGAY